MESDIPDSIENIIFIPLDDDIFIPYLCLNATVSHPDVVASVRKAERDGGDVFFFYAPPSMPEETNLVDIDDIYGTHGVLGRILDTKENPDGSLALTADLNHQASISALRRRLPYMRGDVLPFVPGRRKKGTKDTKAEGELEKVYWQAAGFLPDESRKMLKEGYDLTPADSVVRLHFMIQNSPLNADSRYYVLTSDTYSERRDKFIESLNDEVDNMKMKAELNGKTMSEMARRQKDEFLRTQLQVIKKDLGESGEEDADLLLARGEENAWSAEAKEYFQKEVRKLQRHNPTSADYAVQYAYLDTFVSLPWGKCDDSDITLAEVQEVLDRDHYGLEKVKERIVEQMAVMKLRKDTKAPILCLYGPPGVGKTSLGKSVAQALGRKYVRVALGGVHDEAEIRGHRRTYLGSMPGRIIAGIEKSGTDNPVIVLDEVDKLGKDHKGDPSTALLEVLDPEQNCKFHDNYIDFDYDLSKVLFIATANSLSEISRPLLDRMEVTELTGYVEAEKLEIAKRHLVPKNLSEHGFDKGEITFTDDAILSVVRNYTRESGVRLLEKKIGSILRKLARPKAEGLPYPKLITPEEVGELLGKPDILPDEYEGNDIPGVVTGLAWTQAGGEILYIESSMYLSKEAKLTLTGSLGDVMKESAVLALQYIKANASKLGVDMETLEKSAIHLHVPEGAVPKDGPSAGVTIFTSLLSTFTSRKVRERLAMTGEITLRGRVTAVGGVKEKILAAKRAGIDTILLSEQNRKDIEEIKKDYLEGLSFHYVTDLMEVVDFALLD